MSGVLCNESGTVKCIDNTGVEKYLAVGKLYHATMTGMQFPISWMRYTKNDFRDEIGAIYFVNSSEDGLGHNFRFDRFEVIKHDDDYRARLMMLEDKMNRLDCAQQRRDPKSFFDRLLDR